jgi:amino acid transporter/nucleotide-binding universal stress UspA family protein
MTKTLERDLGLPAVVAISMGAMVGSGIFILPALAYGVAGPSVVLVYVLAGLLVLPAALSQSELATAMPEAGGAYLYIERGLGPLFGTVAGLGTWFSLTFKGALALVGGVPYVLLLFAVPDGYVTPLALGLATVLVGINLLGAKQTGLTQVGVVVLMLVALVWFVAGGGGAVAAGNFTPFLTGGTGGLVAAIGLVFVSYAGVTKVASVAEEIERPDRNIPLGIIGSLLVTTALYALIVVVMIGVIPGDALAVSTTPMAVAAEATLGDAGVAAVVLAAVLALVSTANAGVLSASRYPFAMARDRLVPRSLGAVSDRFGTPSTAITATGAVTLVLVAFVPIAEIAKLASAFQFLVFALVNLAVVVFREGDVEYDPSFRSPLYPWVQLFGVATSLLLLTRMGLVPLVGALLIVAGGVVWYLAYARPRVRREGVAGRLLRRHVGRAALARTRRHVGPTGAGATGAGGSVAPDTAGSLGVVARERTGREPEPNLDPADRYEVLVALTEETSVDRERALLALGADLVRPHGGRVVVIRFDRVHDQVPLDHAAETRSPADVRFEERTGDLAADLDVDVRWGEIVSHDTKHAIVNDARHRGVDVLLVEHERLRLRSRLVGDPIDWVVRHAPCDVVLVAGGRYDRPGRVVLAGDGGLYDPTTVGIADALAGGTDSPVALQAPTEESRPDGRTGAAGAHRAELAAMLSAPVRVRALGTDGGGGGTGLRDGDVVVRHGRDRRRRGDRDATGVPGTDHTEVVVYPNGSDRWGFLRRAVERLVF